MSAIKKGEYLKSRRYRNRRLGDFLKELELTEGRSTGVPTIQEKLTDNGSPRATFETTEERLAFLIHIPVHPLCNNQLVVNDDEQHIGSEKSSDRPQDMFQVILDAIRKDAKVTADEIAMHLGVSSRAVQKRFRVLRENGVIRRVGPDKGGSWEIISER